MIPRRLARTISRIEEKYPVIVITGPRQSGKTTLARHQWPKLPYVNLEDPDLRQDARSDPRYFLSMLVAQGGGILDEIQRVPELTSYLQVIVDEPKFNGLFVLTGSQSFALRDTLAQSLAGRAALFELLPFALSELPEMSSSIDEVLFKGFYPRIYAKNLEVTRALADYVATYVERDLRQLVAVKDLDLFQKFLKLCANRIGQLLNLQSLANETGISQPTAREWLHLLEASYIVVRLPPFHKNLNKRLVKTPKLYFVDVGLAGFLLDLEEPGHLRNHPLRGALFENLVVSEAFKYRLNRGKTAKLYFYRDNNGNEVDLLLSRGDGVIPIEVKVSQTIDSSFFKGLAHLKELVPYPKGQFLVYGGSTIRRQAETEILPITALAQALR